MPSLPAESVCRQLLLYGSPYLCHGGRDSGHDCGTKQPSKRAGEAAIADILVPQGTMSTRAASAPRPPQATDGSGTGTTHRTEVRDAPSGSKERGGSETEDKCLPPHLADTFAGKNRPMIRAMEWLLDHQLFREAPCRLQSHLGRVQVRT